MGLTWAHRLGIATAATLAAGLMTAPATLAAPVPGLGSVTADDPAGSVRVMARNLYLGADTDVVRDLLPDMPAAAQVMWDQVAATDFDQRVALLAEEAAAAKPDMIGLQEATIWSCRPKPWSSPVPVFDFTEQFLEATAEAGVPYQVAESGGTTAQNPGYGIPPIPFLTTMNDPDTFQPLFGSDTADCGFVIGDALLVREDIAKDVLAVGTGEYEERYPVAPVVFEVDRGYAWADIAIAGTTVRVVTTHLESSWKGVDMVPSAEQARQLVTDLSTTTVPTIVMGDFNSDPRDPREPGSSEPGGSNPGGQPEASDTCPAQSEPVTAANADASCSAYWTMIDAGYTDVGPDAMDPKNRTWGADGDLAGPKPERLEVALEQGNDAGFTDRLDYVFTRNGATPVRAEVFGNTWPDSDQVWACDDPSQIATTEESSAILAEKGLPSPSPGAACACRPTMRGSWQSSTSPPGHPVPSPSRPPRTTRRSGSISWAGS